MKSNSSSTGGQGSVIRAKDKAMKANTGKLTGTGIITRADGTVEEFTITSDITPEQAERLHLKPSNPEETGE